MKTRYLKISGELWIEILKGRPQHFQAIKNALPEDAKCVGIRSITLSPGVPVTISLEITSSVFRDDDPDDLPLILIKSLD